MSVPFVGKLPSVIQDTTQLAFVHLDVVIAKNLYHISYALDLVKVYKQTAEQLADLRKTYDIPKDA